MSDDQYIATFDSMKSYIQTGIHDAESIDDVVTDLENLLQWARERQQRIEQDERQMSLV